MILVNSKSCLKDFSRKHLVQEETVLLCLEGGFYDRASLSDGHHRYSNTWAGRGEHSVDSETFETKAIYSFLLTASALLSPWQDWKALLVTPATLDLTFCFSKRMCKPELCFTELDFTSFANPEQ